MIPTNKQAYVVSEAQATIRSIIFPTPPRDPGIYDTQYPLYQGWVNTLTKAIWYLESFSTSGGTTTAIWRALPPVVTAEVAPQPSDYLYPIGQPWVNTVTLGYWILLDVTGTTATWVKLSTGTQGVDFLAGNTGGDVGPDTNGLINVVGDGVITVSGDPGTNTLTITHGPASYPITPYVVGPVDEAGYQTIQDGIDAANTAGGGVVYIQPGTYTEDLTLYSEVDLVGTPASSAVLSPAVLIDGTHIPPTSGNIAFRNICFIDATAAFSSAAAGTTVLRFSQCQSAIESGYFLSLGNWNGLFELEEFNSNVLNPPTSIDDGGLNNPTGTSTIYIKNSLFGSGSSQSMTIGGNSTCEGWYANCEVTFANASVSQTSNTIFNATVTFSDSASMTGRGITFNSSAASSALVYGSSGDSNLTHLTFNGATSPIIGGSGSGTLTLSNVTYIGSATLAGTLTLGGTAVYPAAMSNGALLIGSVGQPSTIGNITSSGGTITITNGAGTINLETDGQVGVQFDGNTGSAVPAAGVLNVVGANGLTVTGSGSTLTVDGAVTSVTGDSGTATPSSGVVDISGGTTGLTTSGASNAITLAGTLAVANGGSGTSTAFTQGSVIFAGASGVYSQDNSNFYWDNTNKVLALGTTPTTTDCHLELTANSGSGSAMRVQGWGFGAGWGSIYTPISDASSPQSIRFENAAGGQVGSISENGTNTAYNTTSDRRLKENIEDAPSQLEALNSVHVRRFNFKSAPQSVQVGFIADELEDEGMGFMVQGDKGQLDGEGNILPQQVDYSKLVPHLLKGIQELTVRVQELETMVQNLT